MVNGVVNEIHLDLAKMIEQQQEEVDTIENQVMN